MQRLDFFPARAGAGKVKFAEPLPNVHREVFIGPQCSEREILGKRWKGFLKGGGGGGGVGGAPL